jgi:hypothetical protein
MKLPKLKYYYHAMTSDEYIAFAQSRELEVTGTLLVNFETGAVSGRTRLILTAGAVSADEQFRQANNSYTLPVYVLRIPNTLVDRRCLSEIKPNIYAYNSRLTVPQCGVERIEYDPSSAASSTKVIDTAELKHI